MEQALKLALEGGWKPKGQNFSLDSIAYKVQALSKVKYKERFLLDPTFWQALGKALGWDKPRFPDRRTYWTKQSDVAVTLLDGWENEMHNFIDHLAEGKDANSFFEELLSTQP